MRRDRSVQTMQIYESLIARASSLGSDAKLTSSKASRATLEGTVWEPEIQSKTFVYVSYSDVKIEAVDKSTYEGNPIDLPQTLKLHTSEFRITISRITVAVFASFIKICCGCDAYANSEQWIGFIALVLSL